MKTAWRFVGFVSVLIVGCGQPSATPPKPKLPVAQTNGRQQLQVIESASIARHELPDDSNPIDVEMETVATEVPVVSSDSLISNDPSMPKPLDLTQFYQTSAAEFDKIDTHPWLDVPKGTQTFGKVPVEIGGFMCLWGRSLASQGTVLPEYIEEIPVGRKFGSLYLYHCTRWKSADETPVVHLIFNFDKNESASHEIRYGTHVRDWFWKEGDPEGVSDPLSKRVWKGVNSMNPPAELHFFLTELKNTRPMDEVVSIDLVSAHQGSTSCILAMTTGPAGLLKEDP